MSDVVKFIREWVTDQEGANAMMGRLFEAARPEAVFGAPVTHGETTVITASEVSLGLGYGFGGGGGGGPADEGAAEDGGNAVGYGGGGGGAGACSSRPVSVIEVGPEGVRVQPIVDPTKIVLALFTTVGAMLLTLGKMKHVTRKG